MVQVRYFHRLHVSSGKQFMVFGIENNVFSLGFDGTTVRWVILRHGCWWDSVSSSFTTRENENKGKQKQNHLHAFFLSFEVLQCVAVLSSFPSLCRRSQMEYIIQPKLLSYLFVCVFDTISAAALVCVVYVDLPYAYSVCSLIISK